MENLVLTGGTGFLGRPLAGELGKYYRVRCLVRGSSVRAEPPNVTWHDFDFSNPDFDPATFRDVSAIVHALSVKSAADPDVFRINVDFTRKLVDFAASGGVKKLVYISSETVQLPGEDAYTKSKKLAEEIVLGFGGHLILRPTVMYGTGDRSNIGLLAKFIKAFPVVPVIGAGSQLMQPVHVDDVVQCVVSGLRNDIKGTFLIAGRSPLPYNEIVEIIVKGLGKRRVVVHVPLFVAGMAASLCRLSGLQLIQKSQVDNLKVDRKYAVGDVENIFRITLKDPREQIPAVIKSLNG